MTDPFKTAEFKALKAKWDEKLKNSGHDDIEREDGSLKEWSSSIYVGEPNPIVRQAKEDYYRLAGQMLYDYRFKNATERFIWEQHSNAVSIRDIKKLLVKKRIKMGRDKVQDTIRKIAREMVGKCSKKPIL